MQIQVDIISVGTPQTVPTKGGKSYQFIEVVFKKDGKVEGKKIMDFVNPTVFKSLQNLSAGQSVTITQEKSAPNNQGQSFWQWQAIDTSGAAPQNTTPSTASTGGGATKSTGSNWETKEERAEKQVMIVRQSSLANAVALAAATSDKKASAESVIQTARTFESYVLDTTPPAAAKNSAPEVADDDFPDDIPY